MIKETRVSLSLLVLAFSSSAAMGFAIIGIVSTRFFDVEGVPVSIIEDENGADVLAFDSTPPRRFPVLSVFRNGSEILEDEFNAMINVTGVSVDPKRV